MPKQNKRYRFDLGEQEYNLLDRYRQILGLRSHTEALRVLINSYVPIAINNHQRAIGFTPDLLSNPSLPNQPTEQVNPPEITPESSQPPETPPENSSEPPKMFLGLPEPTTKPSVQPSQMPLQADQIFGDLMRRLS